MKTLILYYSYGGNTRRIAGKLQAALGADAAEIQTAKPYTGSYDDVVAQGQREVNSGYLPEIAPLDIDLGRYDTVVLGSPVWWYTFAPAMNAFLRMHDLSGKTVWPFATNGGWLGHTLRDFKSACAGADVREGLNVRFNEARQITPDAEVEKWARQIGSGLEG
ncbi:MAG: flavodoxin [Clostridiales bacterium]|nr:flavodoxin [Clostridiales bacterium]MDO4350368.1 flavodoxin [Eubacteriales bacterium]MDY4009632.1 flavodoxin [Candidatus Limiplasma sp.]